MKTLEEYQQDLADLKATHRANKEVLNEKETIRAVKEEITKTQIAIAEQNKQINKPD